MKLNFKDFSRKCQFPLMYASGGMPLLATLFAVVTPERMGHLWAFTGVYLVLALLGLTVPGKRRLRYGILSLLTLAALGILASARIGNICPLIAALFYCLLLLWSLRSAAWGWDGEVSPYGYFLGFGIHAGVRFVLWFIISQGAVILDIAQTAMDISFWCFALTVMLAMNRDSLYFAAKGWQRTSQSMRRKNLLLVSGMFVLALGVSLLPAAAGAVRAFLALLYRLLTPYGKSGEDGVTATGSAQPENVRQPVTDATPLSPFFQFLDQILTFLTKVFIVLAIVLAVFYLVKLLVWLARKLMKWLSRFTASVSEDYVDEITDLRETGDRDTLSRRARRARIDGSDVALPPEMRIRRRYLRLLVKHPEWSAGSTARENLSADAATLYERARYSDHPVTEADAAKFRAGTRRG